MKNNVYKFERNCIDEQNKFDDFVWENTELKCLIKIRSVSIENEPIEKDSDLHKMSINSTRYLHHAYDDDFMLYQHVTLDEYVDIKRKYTDNILALVTGHLDKDISSGKMVMAVYNFSKVPREYDFIPNLWDDHYSSEDEKSKSIVESPLETNDGSCDDDNCFLFKSAIDLDVDGVKACIKSGADLNMLNVVGHTALTEMLFSWAEMAMTDYYVACKHDESIESWGSGCFMCLHKTQRQIKNLKRVNEIAGLLMIAGADPYLKGEYGYSAVELIDDYFNMSGLNEFIQKMEENNSTEHS